MPTQSIRPWYVSFLTIVIGSLSCQTNSSPNSQTTSEAKAMSIQDIMWQLVEIGGKPAEPVPADDRAAHFRLDSAEKRASGYSSVNNFSGPYELSGNSLKFGMLAMTRRAGPAHLMQQEQAFTQALANTVSWRAAGLDIELLDASGKTLARFSPSPDASSG